MILVEAKNLNISKYKFVVGCKIFMTWLTGVALVARIRQSPLWCVFQYFSCLTYRNQILFVLTPYVLPYTFNDFKFPISDYKSEYTVQ
jgi:hypothetical protein